MARNFANTHTAAQKLSLNNNNDRRFLTMIEGLETKLSSLDEKKCPLIQETLGGDWLNMSGKVVKRVEHFISELLVIRPIFGRTVIRSLLQKLIVHTDVSVEIARDDESISKQEKKVFQVVHRTLKGIFEAFPTFEDDGVKIMADLFPYMTKGAHMHFCYVTNLIECMNYMPQSKMSILHMIIHKLAKIDVNIQRDEVEELYERLESIKNVPEGKVKLEDGGFLEIELNPDMETSEESQLIRTLDVCLQVLFQFFENEFETIARVGRDPDSQKKEMLKFFNSCLSVSFDKELLPSFATNHVQFLFFYLTSFQPEFIQVFLERLWEKVTCLTTPPVLRIQAMSYISGLLSRSQLVTIKIVKRWLTKLAQWANAYMDEKVHDCHWASINLSSHGTFYAVCQTLFYVFAFRNKELLGSRKSSVYTRTLNLGRLITSDLNPLKACSSSISETFVEAANYHQISYCRTVLDRNQRCTIPMVSARDMDAVGSEVSQLTSNSLESFFPFSPYLLPRTKKWVDPLYRTYDPYLPELKIEKKEEMCEDSIEMELSTSYTDSSCLVNSLNSLIYDEANEYIMDI